jgi:hypothetical protein
MSPKRSHRTNSPFSTEKETWIVLEFGKLRSATLVRRRFRNVFMVPWYKVPSVVTFSRIITRFTKEGHLTAKCREEGR